jgi:DDHD domain.
LSIHSEPMPKPPNRIEFIPIEWYDKIHSSSSALKKNLLSTTLGTIPKLRSIANDVIFDVLMYMTPEFCEDVLNCVTDQIIRLYDLFKLCNSDFTNGGSVSLIGHSLGSVITWDILSLLGDRLKQKSSKSGSFSNPIVVVDDDDDELKSFRLPHDSSEQAADVYKAYATESGVQVTNKRGTWGPSIVRKVSQTIPFVPKFTFFLGSPLGLFLTLRGARPSFDDLRLKEKRPLRIGKSSNSNVQPTSPFTLPSGAVYNIFHPSDPVAYRIEPLLLPEDFDDLNLPKPCFLMLDGKGLRLHVQARELGDSIAKTVTGLLSMTPSQRSIEKLPLPMVTKNKKSDELAIKFALGGKSERVDYQLQPGVVENEYISAVSAHTSYWMNDDLLEFFIQCANR